MIWIGVLILIVLLPAAVGEFNQHYRIEKMYWKDPDRFGKQNERRKQQRQYYKHH